jgi:hypothetical protein
LIALIACTAGSAARVLRTWREVTLGTVAEITEVTDTAEALREIITGGVGITVIEVISALIYRRRLITRLIG